MPSRWRTVAALALALMAAAIGAAVLVPRLTAPSAGGDTPPRPSPTATAPATASPPSGAPVRLAVPSIRVDAPVEQVGTTPNGDMDTPRDPSDVAWYAPGVKPGLPGDAVVAGHLDTAGGPAVFARLGMLQLGAIVTVHYAGGGSARFRVSRIASYAVDDEPAYLFGTDGGPMLTLITCAGAWDGAQYTHRLVVDAVPA